MGRPRQTEGGPLGLTVVLTWYARWLRWWSNEWPVLYLTVHLYNGGGGNKPGYILVVSDLRDWSDMIPVVSSVLHPLSFICPSCMHHPSLTCHHHPPCYAAGACGGGVSCAAGCGPPEATGPVITELCIHQGTTDRRLHAGEWRLGCLLYAAAGDMGMVQYVKHL